MQWNFPVIIYSVSSVIALIVVSISLPDSAAYSVQIRTIGMTQAYAGLAMLYLYVTLLISPLYHVFPMTPGRPFMKHIRKHLGICAFAFSMLHIATGYFALGGISMLPFYGPSYIWSLLAGTIAGAILTVLAVTSIRRLKRILGTYWKPIHRFVYAAGILTLVHVFTVTTHLSPNEQTLSVISFILIGILCILETIRLKDYLVGLGKRPANSNFGWIASAISVGVLYWAFFVLYHPH